MKLYNPISEMAPCEAIFMESLTNAYTQCMMCKSITYALHTLHFYIDLGLISQSNCDIALYLATTIDLQLRPILTLCETGSLILHKDDRDNCFDSPGNFLSASWNVFQCKFKFPPWRCYLPWEYALPSQEQVLYASQQQF